MNNIAFKSKICFVDKSTFLNTVQGKEIAPELYPAAFADKFYTTNIRTCTAGGIVAPEIEAYGYHIYDGELTNQTVKARLNLDILLFDAQPSQALVIGSKAHFSRPYSQKNFKLIEATLNKHVDNVSVFEKHTDPYAQSHLHYNLKTDTYTIVTQFFRDGKEECIRTLQDLLNNFKRIEIAKGNSLFIGKQEITKKLCPKIFKI